MSNKRTRMIAIGVTTILTVVVIAIIAGRGGETPATNAVGTDRAFTADMIPHHKSAVAMAQIARERSKRPEIQRLAGDIIRTQDAEIAQMQAIDKRLAADGAKKGSLGVGQAMMGMSGDVSSLKTADPFDRAFIDMMIPHHQGAIEMSRVELAKGGDPQAKKLATAITAAQTREIKLMNAYRKAWFGSVSPAGGVPAHK